jgi:hypothetical protein
MKASFYETVLSIVKSTPNNMSLGDSVRALVYKIEESKKSTDNPNQMNIFDVIKEN